MDYATYLVNWDDMEGLHEPKRDTESSIPKQSK